MKQKITLLTGIAVLFFCFIVSAQEYKEIDFFKLSDIEKFYYYNHETKVKVKIINLNRFLYKVDVNKTDTDFNMEVPAILSGLTLPGFITGKPAPTTKSAPLPVPYTAGLTVIKTIHDELIKNLEEIIKTENYINDMVDLHNACLYLSKNCDKKGPEIIADVKTKIFSEATGYGIPSGDIQAMADALSALAITNIKIANGSYDNMELLYKDWLIVRLKDNRSSMNSFNATLIAKQSQVASTTEYLKTVKDQAKKDSAKTELLNQQTEQKNIETNISRAGEDLKQDNDDEKAMMDKAKASLTDINKYKEDGKIYTVFDDLKKINPSSYQYTSEMVRMEKDEVRFSFDIASEQLMSCNRPNQEKFDVVLRTKGGFKIDFSAGLFGSAGNAEFLGNDYFYQPVTDSTSVITSPTNGRKVILSVGALMHIYWRFPWVIKPALSLGASLSTGSTILNYHGGLSMILGNKDRLIVTGGITLRETQVLDNNYSTAITYNKDLLPSDVPTVNKFPVCGYFFSLTYNFSGFNK